MTALVLLIGIIVGAVFMKLVYWSANSLWQIPLVPHVIVQEADYGGWTSGERCAIWFADGVYHRQFENEARPRFFPAGAIAVTPDLATESEREAIGALRNPEYQRGWSDCARRDASVRLQGVSS